LKVTRSFWLGLGSGLILSAMLTLLFSPQQKPSDVQLNPQTALPKNESTKEPDPPPPVQPIESDQKESLPPDPQVSPQIDRDFVIPKGASAEQIADLLFAQELIKDKEAFLAFTRQMRAERRFRAGTFKLSVGLSEEEVIFRLLK